jgi:hypothetical protein
MPWAGARQCIDADTPSPPSFRSLFPSFDRLVYCVGHNPCNYWLCFCHTT